MPWDHCGATIPDTQPCPGCGLEKAAWTVDFEVTRTFQVRRRQLVRFSLADRGGDPLIGEPWRVTLEDGRVVEGALDDLGAGKVEAPAGRLEFPERGPDDVAPAPLEDAPPPTGPPERAPFAREAGRAHRFLLASLIRAQLFGTGEETPLANADYQVQLTDGATLSGTTDGEGLITHLDVAPGHHVVTAAGLWGLVDAFVGGPDDPPSHVRLGARIHARLFAFAEARPLADTPYEVTVDGRTLSGRTDAEGRLTIVGVAVDYYPVTAAGLRGEVDAHLGLVDAPPSVVRLGDPTREEA